MTPAENVIHSTYVRQLNRLGTLDCEQPAGGCGERWMQPRLSDWVPMDATCYHARSPAVLRRRPTHLHIVLSCLDLDPVTVSSIAGRVRGKRQQHAGL